MQRSGARKPKLSASEKRLSWNSKLPLPSASEKRLSLRSNHSEKLLKPSEDGERPSLKPRHREKLLKQSGWRSGRICRMRSARYQRGKDRLGIWVSFSRTRAKNTQRVQTPLCWKCQSRGSVKGFATCLRRSYCAMFGCVGRWSCVVLRIWAAIVVS